MIALPPYALRLPDNVAQAVRGSGYRFVVTGARGWLGRATLDLLESALGAELAGRVHALGSSDGTIRTRGGQDLPVRELAATALGAGPSLLLHYAYLTKDRLGSMASDEYRRRNAAIRDEVVSWVRSRGVRGVFLPSSGAVYAALGTASDREGRGTYGADKLQDEKLFAGACQAAGARLLVARIFSLSGPHINKHGSYVLAAILLSILNGEPVMLQAQRPVYRSYIAVADLLSIALGWLILEGTPGQMTIDASSSEILELGELAQRAIDVLKMDTVVERPAVDPGDPDRYVGNPQGITGLATALGQRLASIDRQIIDTAAFLAETTNTKIHVHQ